MCRTITGIVCAAVAWFFLAPPVHGGVTETNSGFQLPADLPQPASDDLLQNHLHPTLGASASATGWGSDINNLFDGQFALTGNPPEFITSTPNTWGYDGDATLKFWLDKKYDLDEIRVVSGYGDGRRADQHWDVFTSSDGGTTWTPLHTSSYALEGALSEGGKGMAISLTSDNSDPLAYDVNAVRFDTKKPAGYWADVYQEIDIAAQSPEIREVNSGFQDPGDLPQPSENDLLQTNLAQATASNTSWGSDIENLYDGTFAAGTGTTFPGSTGDTWGSDGPATLDFLLDRAFDLAEIRVISGYGIGARSDQHWNVLVSSDNGTTWAPLYESSFAGQGGVGENGQGMAISLTSANGFPLATSVNAVRFEILAPGYTTSNADVFQEIDITAVPEPSTAILLIVGLAVCLPRRKRKGP